MNTFRVIVVGSCFALLSCGETSPQRSAASDVALPGSPAAQNKLVWFDGGLMVVGNCAIGHLPSRENCPRFASNVWDGVAGRVEGSLDTEVAAKEAAYTLERDKLRETHPEVVAKKREITTLDNDVRNLEDRVPTYELAISKKRADAAAQDAIILEYDPQIAAVKDRLIADPTNPDLKRLLETLQLEREALVVKKQALLEQAQRLETGLAEVRRLITDKKQVLVQRKLELSALYQQVTVTSPALEILKADWETLRVAKDHLPRILTYIRDARVAYRYDLLDKTDQVLIDRLILAVGERQLTIRFNGPDKAMLILHDNEWRAICDDGFDQAEADVICRSVDQKTKSFKAGAMTDGKFWLDDLRCSGSEESIEGCPANPWGQHNCGPSEGVAVQCE